MNNMLLSEWLMKNPAEYITVNEEASLETIITKVMQHPVINDIYVVDSNDCPVGHISKMRLARIYLSEHRQTQSRRQLLERVVMGCAREIMSSSFPIGHADEYIFDVIHKQVEHELFDMAVINNSGRMIGAVTINDILRSYLK